jgi:outer membrane biosynthesis protein TonB
MASASIRKWIDKDPLQAYIFFAVVAFHIACLAYIYIDSWAHPEHILKQDKHLVVKTIQLDSTVKKAPSAPKQAVTTAKPVIETAVPTPAPTIEKEAPKKEESKPKKPAAEEIKPKETPKQVKEEKKSEKVEQPKKKTETKVEKSKEVAKPKTEKKAAAKSTTTTSEKSTQESKKKQELLKQAQNSLAKLNNANPNAAVAAVVAPTLTPIGPLHLDASATSGDTSGSQEIGYVDEMVGRLKLLLKLPEYGDVKTQLIINRSGKVVKVTILHADSKANRSYIEKTLPTLTFAPFGSNFGAEGQHTFQITLKGD